MQWLEKAGLMKGFGRTPEGTVQLYEEYKSAQKRQERESFARYNRLSQLKPNESDIGPAVEVTAQIILVAAGGFVGGGGAAGTMGGGGSLALAGGGTTATASAVSVSKGVAVAGGLGAAALINQMSGGGGGGGETPRGSAKYVKELEKQIKNCKDRINDVEKRMLEDARGNPAEQAALKQQWDVWNEALKRFSETLRRAKNPLPND